MEKIKNFLFKNTTTRQTIVKNTFWISFSTGLSKIIRSSVIIFAARILGTEHYGSFTYALSLATIFSIFSDIGLSGLLTRELVKKREDTQNFASTTLLLKLGLIAVSTIFIAIVGPHVAKFSEAKSLMLIIAVILAFDSMRGFFYSITRSENRMQTEAFLEIITEVFITIFCLYFLFTERSAMGLAVGYMMGGGIGLLISIIVFRKYFSNFFQNFKRSLISPIMSSAWPFAVMGIFGVMMTNIDSFIIGLYSNESTLGLYAAAQRPMSLIYILPGLLYSILFPITSKLAHKEEKSTLALLIKKSVLFSLLVAIPLTVGGIILAMPLINTVFGYEFIGATLTFQILLVTLLPIFPGTIFSNVIFAEDKQKVFLKSSIIGASINVGLDFFLIPMVGIVGSAIATLVSVIFTNMILYFEIKKHHQISFVWGLKKILLATVLMGLSILIMKNMMISLIIIVPVAIVIYFAILILSKEQLLKDLRQSFHS